MTNIRQENNVTNCTSVVYIFMMLNYHDQLDQVSTLKKTRHDSCVTDHINVVYAKNETEQL